MVGIGLLPQALWVEILIISAILALFTTLAYKYFTDQAVLREVKKEQDALRAQMKEHKNDPQKLSELNSKMMKLSAMQFKGSMKPMIITMIPFLLIFGWLKSTYNTAIVLPLPFWQGHLGWFGAYLIFTMVLSMVFRKALKVV